VPLADLVTKSRKRASGKPVDELGNPTGEVAAAEDSVDDLGALVGHAQAQNHRRGDKGVGKSDGTLAAKPD
jgi:hypothetical protein